MHACMQGGEASRAALRDRVDVDGRLGFPCCFFFFFPLLDFFLSFLERCYAAFFLSSCFGVAGWKDFRVSLGKKGGEGMFILPI